MFKSVRVQFFVMDIELLFSRDPFMQENAENRFGFVAPNVQLEIQLGLIFYFIFIFILFISKNKALIYHHFLAIFIVKFR